MQTKANKALLFGVTGLVGKELLKLLLEDETYGEVIAFVRKPFVNAAPKLTVILFDYDHWDNIEDHFTPNAHVFCCVGTTRSKTPDRDEYHKIDYGIPVQLASYASRGSCRGIYIISSIGANEKSSHFYQRTKGEMERDISKKHIRETYFFRPSLLLGNRDETRAGESIGKVVNSLLAPFMSGALLKYKGINAATVAKAMINVSKNGFTRQVVENDQIFKLGGKAQ